MNNLHYKELQRQFDEGRDSLARLDVDIEQQGVKLLKNDRHSLRWNQELATLNSLNKKRKLACVRLASLRIMMNKIESRPHL
ncbi:unnamed protein product [marine sediment metagenome]|uniref:Uncharacterized protein n=1 Tax=marine sediment metagenome TaxID=412755 RepID=X1HCS4_9ZZZZ